MREFNLDQLQSLVSISDLGTFSAAALALHLSQPTVSLHISELEDKVGTKLLVRGGRRVIPTAAGATLIEHARRLLRSADEARCAVKRHLEGRAGRVRLGTSTGIAVYLLPEILKKMQQDYPEVDVEIQILSSSMTMMKLSEGALDIGLVATPQTLARDFVMTHWRSDPMIAFVPPNWAIEKFATPEWLSSLPLILSDPTTHMYQLTMAWFAAAGCSPRARIEHSYTETIKSLVAAGYGAAILPKEHLENSLLTQQLQAIPLEPSLTRHVGIVHHELPFLDGATSNLLKTLKMFGQT
jgi:DNA-binding transcriptional LysR family regulator